MGVEMSTTVVAVESRRASAVMSSALRGFESNPFRVLRLRVNATTSDAALQAEQALTLARVGLSPDEPDPLPWLNQSGAYEIQQAAQAAEEPFVRLKYQLLWFDLERDPQSAVLADALRDLKGASLRQYLDADLGLRPPGDGEGKTRSDAFIAHGVNQANLRLLAAAAAANGFLAPTQASGGSTPKISKEMWKSVGRFRALAQGHNLLRENVAAGDSGIGTYWETGLKKWSDILVHPDFKSYLGTCISDLQDDFISVDESETVEENLRTHLADLSAQEARFFLQAGRYPVAASLIAAISRSGMDLRILAPAMRPLRQVFQSEIAELESLLEEPGYELEPIGAYLKRLEWIRARWIALDSGGVVGLRDILDGAVEKAYQRLRASEKTDCTVGRLLIKIRQIATANSLKERVSGYEKELEQARTRVCYFCGGAPDYDRSVVLNGKKETHREHHFNRTTIHYAVRSAIVLRCARCAQLHDYINKVGMLISICSTPGILAIIISLFK
jgi:hypothetical protein